MPLKGWPAFLEVPANRIWPKTRLTQVGTSLFCPFRNGWIDVGRGSRAAVPNSTPAADFGLKTHAVGAYLENGPGSGCASIDPRRIRLVARRRQRRDAPHPGRTQETID